MASFAVGLNQWVNYKAPPVQPRPSLRVDPETGKIGPDGGQPIYEQSFVTNLSFSNAQQTNTIDLTSDDRAYDFSIVSMFVDNSSQNSVPLLFVIGGTGQRIVIKANTQGYYPVVSQARNEGGGNVSAQVFAPTAGAQFLAQVMLLNYMIEPFVWPTV